MQERGWSWRDVMDAPARFIEEVLFKMHTRRHWQIQKDKKEQAFAEQKAKQKNR